MLDTIKTFVEIIIEEKGKEKINYNLYNDFDIQLKNPIHILRDCETEEKPKEE